jgi:hypothetical protein
VEQQQDNTSIEYFQKLEKWLADILGLSDLRSGEQVLRNERGWRVNEKHIDYIWIVQITRSFIGWGGIFSIKFAENKFGEHLNKEELKQGLFLSDQNGVQKVYTRTSPDTTKDIIDHFRFDLFEPDKGFNIDGVIYNIRISVANVNSFIRVNNPNTGAWGNWERKLLGLGKELAKESGNDELISLFAPGE